MSDYDEDYSESENEFNSSSDSEEEEEETEQVKKDTPTIVLQDSDSEDEESENEDVDVVPEDNDEIEDDSDVDLEDDEEPLEEKPSLEQKKSKLVVQNFDEDDDDEEDENYQKFSKDITKNYILDYHPECFIQNYDEISVLTKVHRDKNNSIIDALHRTVPFLTKYEKARVLGQRAKQINSGARPFVKVPENVIDGYLIAELELEQKKIPFIIRRPLPGAGSEYWNLKDLELISF